MSGEVCEKLHNRRIASFSTSLRPEWRHRWSRWPCTTPPKYLRWIWGIQSLCEYIISPKITIASYIRNIKSCRNMKGLCQTLQYDMKLQILKHSWNFKFLARFTKSARNTANLMKIPPNNCWRTLRYKINKMFAVFSNLVRLVRCRRMNRLKGHGERNLLFFWEICIFGSKKL